MYHGDIRLGDTIDIKFTTRRFTTGAPFTLAGTPSVAAYPSNSTTEITAGITLTVDFDTRTGLNNVRVVATSGNGYATATNYTLVITAGTVDGVSVVGECVGSFSIEARSALMPTVAARTLDVTATGAAGIDWANIENPTTAQALTGTTVDLVANAVDAAALAADAVAEIADGVWDEDATAHQTQGTFGQAIGDPGADPDTIYGLVNTNLDAAVSSRASSAQAVAIQADTDDIQTRLPAALIGGRMDSNAQVVGDKTGYSIGVGGIASTAFAANAIDSAALAPSAAQEVADEILNRNLAGGGSGSSRNVRNALRTARNRVVITAGGAMDVYEEDDSTVAWSGTATRTAGANPITEVNPA